MKKTLLFSIIIVAVSLMLIGCSNNLNIIKLDSKKPNQFYYTSILLKSLSSEKPSNCIITETNFHREKQLDADSITDITTMFKSLTGKNFISRPNELPSKPAYKILLIFKQQKLLVNVYNQQYISVYPWDGEYPMDYISTNKIPISLNLYNLGNYMFKQ